MSVAKIPLTTQVYFEGNPFIGKDPFAGHKPSLAIKLESRAAVFDMALASGT